MGEIRALKPIEIAQKLGKSISWVYRHAGELGAARIGGSSIFTEEALNNAIQTGQQVARNRNGEWPEGIKTSRDQSSSRTMGNRKRKRTQVFDTDPGRHGLAHLLFQVSRSR